MDTTVTSPEPLDCTVVPIRLYDAHGFRAFRQDIHSGKDLG